METVAIILAASLIILLIGACIRLNQMRINIERLDFDAARAAGRARALAECEAERAAWKRQLAA